MNRLFKSYGLNAPYDGIPAGADASSLLLDPIDCAGKAKLRTIFDRGISRGFHFVDIIQTILVYGFFLSLLISPIHKIMEIAPTSGKWRDHLRVLSDCSILESVPKSQLLGFARYFAVPKSDGKARAIFNGRLLSTLFRTPRNTNLPPIKNILELISRFGVFYSCGDWRHMFHQFRMNDAVSNWFGMELGGKTYRYSTLPMGFSYSPVIAQSIAWCILLEAVCRAKLAKPEDFTDLNATPEFIILRNAKGLPYGFVSVWYDNVIAGFLSSQPRDDFHTALETLCGPEHFNVAFKGSLGKYSLKDMKPDGDAKKRLKYLGMEFSCRKRSRESDAYEVQLRHDPDRMSRWQMMRSRPSERPQNALARRSLAPVCLGTSFHQMNGQRVWCSSLTIESAGSWKSMRGARSPC